MYDPETYQDKTEGSIIMGLYKTVRTIMGKYTDAPYQIVQFRDGFYSWGYWFDGSFWVAPYEYTFHDDAVKAVQKRDGLVASGNSVMF